MKPLYFLVLSACVTFFCSCNPKKSDPQNPIVAKWTLQQEHAVLYKDNVKIVDTVLNASGATSGNIQFKSDGSFSSSSVFFPDNSLNPGQQPSNASAAGTYSYSASSFSISPKPAGWYTFFTGTSSLSTGYSSAAKITSLSGSNLNLTNVSTFTVTDNNLMAHTYLLNESYYYIK